MKQERAVRTRSDLILAAAEVFDEKGYIAARLAAISQQAHVSVGALHFHFENKEALAAAVERQAAADLRSLMDATRSRGARPALQVLIDTSHAFMVKLRNDVVVRAGLRLNGDTSYGCEEADLRAEWEQCVQRLLDDAEREGTLAGGVAPHNAVTVVVSATAGIEMLGRRSPGWLSPYRMTGIWQMLLASLAAEDIRHRLNPAGAEVDTCEPRWSTPLRRLDLAAAAHRPGRHKALAAGSF
ncbi:ScbR family autoregulator-binding transcription factor [Streptomyces sp. WM6378]|uniref:ScbR family autoregulator-binding transcription factor n=1 Tax=Streptomyces sp. WM6378 TaxID=1415557 RepID=UPI0006AFD72B|nr:ScbR family autoregulator-binding transcription factor [Streptomyces sp. WM6378]